MNIIRKHKLHKNFGTELDTRETVFLAEIKKFLDLLTPHESLSNEKALVYKNTFGLSMLRYNTDLKELTVLQFPFMIKYYGYSEEEGSEIITYFFKEKYKEDSAFRGEK